MQTKQQKTQAKNLHTAKKRHETDKADLRDAIRLSPEAKLSGPDKRRLVSAVKKAKLDGRLPQTAQQTIPYREMCRDGICVVTDRYYTKQIRFYDINYQLAQNEDKNRIFEDYCDFLNYFDSSIHVQFSFLNQRTDLEEYQRAICIPEQIDAYNGIREEYSDMLKDQLAKGNNGLTKTKYITFGVEAESLKAAKARLEQLGATVLMTRDTDVFYTLGERVEMLNEAKPDFFIAVHHNSAALVTDLTNKGGIEAYWFYTEGKPLAENLVAAVGGAVNRRQRGVFYDYFYVTRSNICPAVLLETGFMTDPVEYEKVADETTIWIEAGAIAQGVLNSLPG